MSKRVRIIIRPRPPTPLERIKAYVKFVKKATRDRRVIQQLRELREEQAKEKS